MSTRDEGKECPPPGEAVLLLGSNQGRRVLRIRNAVERISGEAEVLAVSRMYSTEPFGRAWQPWFLNLAVRVATIRTPWELLGFAKRLEREAGRCGGARWGPRPLDVDIILMGNTVVDEPGLSIPHPATASRRFCLRAVADVAPDAVVPTIGRTVSQLLDACEDPLEVTAI